MRALSVLSLAFCLSAVADDCSLSGTLKTTAGQPGADIRVLVTGVERSTMRTYKAVKTDANGQFAIKGLKCGQYQVWTETQTAQPAMIQVNRSSVIDMTVEPRKTVADYQREALEAHERMQAAQNQPDHPELIPIRRAHLAELQPQSVTAYDQASTAQQRRQLFQTAMTQKMMSYTAGSPVAAQMQQGSEMAAALQSGRMSQKDMIRKLREIDRMSQGSRMEESDLTAMIMTNWALDLVQRALGEAEAAKFRSSSEVDRSAIMFRAANAFPPPKSSCSKMGLYYVDMETNFPNMELENSFGHFIGSTGTSWKAMDAKQRCDALTSSRGALLKFALSIVSEANEEKAAALLRTAKLLQFSDAEKNVGSIFGSEAAAKYPSLSPVEQNQLYRAALSFQLSLLAATMAE